MSRFIDISDGGIECRILTYGAALVSFKKDGFDCVLGYDDVDGYKNGDCYFGAVIGRVCNRTSDAAVIVAGRQYDISKNDGANSLHGGFVGFDKREWTIKSSSPSHVALTLYSKDGDEGYPADVNALAEYYISDGILHLHLHAESNRPTPICMTGHSYFNLGGCDVRQYSYMISSDTYCAHDTHGISSLPTPVDGTQFDFRQFSKPTCDCDNHFVFRKDSAFAIAESDIASLKMTTDMPGMQFYDGNSITEGMPLKHGETSKKYCGFCFEPQYVPSFASDGIILCTPQKPFDSHISYRLDLKWQKQRPHITK